MPPRKRKLHSISAGKQSAIVRRTPPKVEDDTNNDETNENESLNQEESSIFVSNQVPNQDIQLDIEIIDLNEGVTNQIRRVLSINTSTNVPFNNSNTRPAISAATFNYPLCPYGQHLKNNNEDEGADADLNLKKKKKTKALTRAVIDLTLR